MAPCVIELYAPAASRNVCTCVFLLRSARILQLWATAIASSRRLPGIPPYWCNFTGGGLCLSFALRKLRPNGQDPHTGLLPLHFGLPFLLSMGQSCWSCHNIGVVAVRHIVCSGPLCITVVNGCMYSYTSFQTSAGIAPSIVCLLFFKRRICFFSSPLPTFSSGSGGGR